MKSVKKGFSKSCTSGTNAGKTANVGLNRIMRPDTPCPFANTPLPTHAQERREWRLHLWHSHADAGRVVAQVRIESLAGNRRLVNDLYTHRRLHLHGKHHIDGGIAVEKSSFAGHAAARSRRGNHQAVTAVSAGAQKDHAFRQRVEQHNVDGGFRAFVHHVQRVGEVLSDGGMSHRRGFGQRQIRCRGDLGHESAGRRALDGSFGKPRR
jgi:hypothetical protein